MDEALPETGKLVPVSHRGTRYGPETRELAYQLWAFKHGQNGTAVAAELQSEFPGLEARTVNLWAQAEGWHDRVERDVTELAPAVRRANVVGLIAGSAEAIQALRTVARGEYTGDPKLA